MIRIDWNCNFRKVWVCPDGSSRSCQVTVNTVSETVTQNIHNIDRKLATKWLYVYLLTIFSTWQYWTKRSSSISCWQSKNSQSSGLAIRRLTFTHGNYQLELDGKSVCNASTGHPGTCTHTHTQIDGQVEDIMPLAAQTMGRRGINTRMTTQVLTNWQADQVIKQSATVSLQHINWAPVLNKRIPIKVPTEHKLNEHQLS